MMKKQASALLHCFVMINWNFLLRKESVPGKSLNLSKDDALQKQVDQCREKYMYLGLMMATNMRTEL